VRVLALTALFMLAWADAAADVRRSKLLRSEGRRVGGMSEVEVTSSAALGEMRVRGASEAGLDFPRRSLAESHSVLVQLQAQNSNGERAWDDEVVAKALEYVYQQTEEAAEKAVLKASAMLGTGAIDTSWDGQASFVLKDAAKRHVPRGFVVDIGAHDGVWQSNSMYFLQHGFPGFLVEAVPETYAKLLTNVKLYPNVITRQAAIGLHDDELVRLVRAGWDDGTENHVLRCADASESCVKSVTLPTLLARNHLPQRNFLLSIDIEWSKEMYLQVFDALSRANYTFEFVIVENCHDPARMASLGYEFLAQFRYDSVYRHL